MVHHFCLVVCLPFEMLAFPSYQMSDEGKPMTAHVYNLFVVSQPYTIGILQTVCAGSISLVRLSRQVTKSMLVIDGHEQQ